MCDDFSASVVCDSLKWLIEFFFFISSISLRLLLIQVLHDKKEEKKQEEGKKKTSKTSIELDVWRHFSRWERLNVRIIIEILSKAIKL